MMGVLHACMNYGNRVCTRPLVAGALLFSIGPAAMLVMPMIVGVYVDELGFTSQQAGLLASVEATGICVASLLGIVWVRTQDWRVVTLSGLGCAIVGNLLAIAVDDFAPMLACRALASLGAGTAFAAATASLGEQKKPETAFGIGLAVQTLLTTIMMAMSAGIIERRALPEYSSCWRCWHSWSPCPLAGCPREAGRSRPSANRSHLAIPPIAPGSLSASSPRCCSTWCAPGFWVYLERIGHAAGDRARRSAPYWRGHWLRARSAGLGPVWLSDRQGIARPIVVATLILIGTVLMAAGDVTVSVFALSAIAFSGMWVFATAYQTALIATLDRYGGYLVLVPAAQGAGAMIGPATASLFVENGAYVPANIVAVSFFAISLMLFFVAMRGIGVSGKSR